MTLERGQTTQKVKQQTYCKSEISNEKKYAR